MQGRRSVITRIPLVRSPNNLSSPESGPGVSVFSKRAGFSSSISLRPYLTPLSSIELATYSRLLLHRRACRPEAGRDRDTRVGNAGPCCCILLQTRLVTKYATSDSGKFRPRVLGPLGTPCISSVHCMAVSKILKWLVLHVHVADGMYDGQVKSSKLAFLLGRTV
ncbi:hypothetical protein LZ31DRAFT_291070 [Colletotrichum somersetense]|nr:hypothetical protein LZ31DRAFT_291070 [Colletotrichum somersetense]